MYFRNILATVILFLLLPTASAQDGCFTFQDSSFYCSDTSLEKAQEECSFHENCALLTAFFEGETCTNKDAFPQCQKVLCKSSCQEEFAGKCVGGEVPVEKKQEWCSPGCCQFSYFGGSFCGYQETKWRCEVEAKNKEVAQFLFAFPMSALTCEQQCSQGIISLEKVKTENVTETILPSLPSYPETDGQKSSTNSFFLEWILFLVLLTSLVYLGHVVWRYSKRSKLEIPADEIIEEKNSWLFDIFKPKSESLKKLHSTRQHKKKHQEHSEILREFSTTTGKKDTFGKLHDLTFHHKLTREKTSFESLEQLNAVLKSKEAKVQEKKEAQKALEKLKEMVRKK